MNIKVNSVSSTSEGNYFKVTRGVVKRVIKREVKGVIENE